MLAKHRYCDNDYTNLAKMPFDKEMYNVTKLLFYFLNIEPLIVLNETKF